METDGLLQVVGDLDEIVFRGIDLGDGQAGRPGLRQHLRYVEAVHIPVEARSHEKAAMPVRIDRFAFELQGCNKI